MSEDNDNLVQRQSRVPVSQEKPLQSLRSHFKQFGHTVKDRLHLGRSRPGFPHPPTRPTEDLPVVEKTSGGPIPETSIGSKRALDGTSQMKTLQGHPQAVESCLGTAEGDLDPLENIETMYLQPLRVFDSVIKEIGNVHPYVKLALGMLSAASRIVLAQAERDTSILELLKKLGDVYDFLAKEQEKLAKIPSMDAVFGKLVQQTCECADFIGGYSETKSFCE
ncbi:hypothetical protein BU17DRAFT_104019 [Hysterangium stoloniferum]|nr:hypothetical protein BU17DRAFT_104019 [Hysterangium stoloniferum]